LLYEIFGEDLFLQPEWNPVKVFTPSELDVLRQMLAKGVQAPRTSSVGRLFDAVASILGIRHVVTYEGQGAMELENAIGDLNTDESYPIELGKTPAVPSSTSSSDGRVPEIGLVVVDWEPMVRRILSDVIAGIETGMISARFHNTLSRTVVEVARRVGEERVVLTGGCFQNRVLAERTTKELERAGFRVYRHQRVPPNDGGIALGQLAAYLRLRNGSETFSGDVRRRTIYEEVVR
jgi:hydrogenase maturation protein HypF